MKKPNNFQKQSDLKCECGSRIKQNVVDRKPTASKCYACNWLESKSHKNKKNVVKTEYLKNRVGVFA